MSDWQIDRTRMQSALTSTGRHDEGGGVMRVDTAVICQTRLGIGHWIKQKRSMIERERSKEKLEAEP